MLDNESHKICVPRRLQRDGRWARDLTATNTIISRYCVTMTRPTIPKPRLHHTALYCRFYVSQVLLYTAHILHASCKALPRETGRALRYNQKHGQMKHGKTAEAARRLLNRELRGAVKRKAAAAAGWRHRVITPAKSSRGVKSKSQTIFRIELLSRQQRPCKRLKGSPPQKEIWPCGKHRKPRGAPEKSQVTWRERSTTIHAARFLYLSQHVSVIPSFANFSAVQLESIQPYCVSRFGFNSS